MISYDIIIIFTEYFYYLTGKSGEVPLEMRESDIDEDYSPATPEQNIGSQKGKDDMSEKFVGSESGSSILSTKEGFEAISSSSSSSDAESGTYNLGAKKYLLRHDNGNEVLKPKPIEAEGDNVDEKENLYLGRKAGREGMLKKMEDVQYEQLLEQVANYEVELKFTKKKLHSKQEENARLKYENLTLVEKLGSTIAKLRTSEDNMVKMEQKFRYKFEESQDQLQGQLELANQSIDLLQSELSSERRLVSELQEMLVKNTGDLCEYGREIDELKHALRDAEEDFSKDRSQFQSETTLLHKRKDALDARLKEAELRNQFLEEQIQSCEAEKAEIKSLHESREMGLLDEIKQLTADLSQRSEIVDSLNKSLDASKLKYDMLMAEKNEVFAKLQTLGAEVNHRDICIQQMEEHMSKLTAENEKLLTELKKTQKLAEELKVKVGDQEKALENQRLVICDRAEEKREAIRQLCFSLEHYRNEYHELRQAFIKQKRSAVLAFDRGLCYKVWLKFDVRARPQEAANLPIELIANCSRESISLHCIDGNGVGLLPLVCDHDPVPCRSSEVRFHWRKTPA
ncbi:hypothetical protein Cgig2_032263 [Carnegiea gigantea]|uniref:Uncharacterized protein n=1 Tax=Carnegiea gigantea TaxID=171969 RepID=A0A9Q1JV83_9CARY|nr:hypothetical protein Cgig2_032263 [Carnegiea gigantea]